MLIQLQTTDKLMSNPELIGINQYYSFFVVNIMELRITYASHVPILHWLVIHYIRLMIYE